MKENKKAESGSKKNAKTKEGLTPEDTNQKLQSECLNNEEVSVKEKKQKKAKKTAEGLVTPDNNKEAMSVAANGETVNKSKKSSRFDNVVTKVSKASDEENEVNVKEPGKKKLKKKHAKANADFEDTKAEEVSSKKSRKEKRENSATEALEGNTSAPAKSELQGSEANEGVKLSEQHDLPKKKKKNAKKSVEDTPTELVTLHPSKSDKGKDGLRTVDAEENAKKKKQKREVSVKETCNDSMVTSGEPAPDNLAGASEAKQVDKTSDPTMMGEKKQEKNAVCGKKRKVVEEEKHSSASMVQEPLKSHEKEDIDKPVANDRVHKKKKQKDVKKIMESPETQKVQLECQSIDGIQEKKKKDKKQKISIEGLCTGTLDEDKDEAGAEKHKKKGKHSKKNADNGLHVREVSTEQHEGSRKELTSNGVPKGKKRKEKYMDSNPDSSQPNCPDPTAHGKDIETKELPSKKSRKEKGKRMNAEAHGKTILEPASKLEESYHMNTSVVEVNKENRLSEQDVLPKRKKKHANKGVENSSAELGRKEGETQIFSGQSGAKVADTEPSAKKKKLKKSVPQENGNDLRFSSGELVANTEGKQANVGASYPAVDNGVAEKKENKNVCGKNQKVAEDDKHILGNTISTSCNGTAKELPRTVSLEQGDKGDVDQPGEQKEKDGKQKTPTGALAFKRVDVEKVDFFDPRLKDNSYWAKDGADEGYGAKAQEVLGQVRGRDFRHEKTKKKRGSYRGGAIDLQSHSIKFSNSDED